jgi:hypothetical protein
MQDAADPTANDAALAAALAEVSFFFFGIPSFHFSYFFKSIGMPLHMQVHTLSLASRGVWHSTLVQVVVSALVSCGVPLARSTCTCTLALASRGVWHSRRAPPGVTRISGAVMSAASAAWYLCRCLRVLRL